MRHSRQKKRVIAALTDSRQKKRVNHFQARPCPIKIKHKAVFSIQHQKKELDLLFWQAKVNHCTCSLWKNAYHGNVNNVTSIATVYWCINVDSTFVYLRPLDFNKDSNNHICWRQMLYKGLVIIITASFSDCKTFGKSLRISVKFCHWNPKNSEILSKLRNSELAGASGLEHWPSAMCWHQKAYSVPEIIAAPWCVHTPWQSVALWKQTCFSLFCTLTFFHT